MIDTFPASVCACRPYHVVHRRRHLGTNKVLIEIDFLISKRSITVIIYLEIQCNISAIISLVSGQLPTRTVPHHVDIGPDDWVYSLVMVLVGSCLSGEL